MTLISTIMQHDGCNKNEDNESALARMLQKQCSIIAGASSMKTLAELGTHKLFGSLEQMMKEGERKLVEIIITSYIYIYIYHLHTMFQ